MLNQHQTIKDNISKFNKPNKLVDFLIPLVGDKKKVKILDVGSGPYSIIGNYLDGIEVELHLADNQNFSNFWKKYNTKPFYNVVYQDMENLTYDANSFDIVTCINALDHTPDAAKAVREMIRVCKESGGWVYIDCHLDQKDTGHKHKWNVKEDGTITDGETSFDLKDFGFKIEFIDNGGERRYNHIIATFKKDDIPEYCAEESE